MSERHTDAFGDDAERQLATMMATHPRLGQDSSQLRDQTAELVTMIAQMGLTPIVERPIRLFVRPICIDHVASDQDLPHDDFVTSCNEAGALTDPPTPFVCTVLDRGVPVLRAQLRQEVNDVGVFCYASRRRDNGERVAFTISTTIEDPRWFGCILEEQLNLALPPAEQCIFWTNTRIATQAELLAFRAQNTLGIELRFTAAAAGPVGPLTPIQP